MGADETASLSSFVSRSRSRRWVKFRENWLGEAPIGRWKLGRARPGRASCSLTLTLTDDLPRQQIAILHRAPSRRGTMASKYGFTQGLKELRFLFCQTSEQSAATRYAKRPCQAVYDLRLDETTAHGIWSPWRTRRLAVDTAQELPYPDISHNEEAQPAHPDHAPRSQRHRAESLRAIRYVYSWRMG